MIMKMPNTMGLIKIDHYYFKLFTLHEYINKNINKNFKLKSFGEFNELFYFYNSKPPKHKLYFFFFYINWLLLHRTSYMISKTNLWSINSKYRSVKLFCFMWNYMEQFYLRFYCLNIFSTQTIRMYLIL